MSEAIATPSANPYLEDFLAPVRAEVTATDLPVTGHIPDFLDGRYLRNGPNPVAEVDPATYHWFTGDGMVHGVSLQGGRAGWYRNRWVRSAAVRNTLGESAATTRNLRAGMQSLGANTNVLAHAGKTLALVEGGVANYELTDELDTVGPCDFDGTLTGGYAAHPHRDPRTGELHAVSYSYARGKSVQYSVIDAQGHARRTVDIEVSGSPMMHDFSLTDKYVVLYDLPVTLDPMQVLPRWMRRPARIVAEAVVGQVPVPGPVAAMFNRNEKSAHQLPYSWNPNYPARIGVMPREGNNRDVRWFDIEPCYVYHPLNAFSEVRGDHEALVLDVVRYERMFDRDRRGPGDTAPTLDRWTINLTTGAVTSDRLDDRSQEFPRINETLLGNRHRFGYTVGINGGFVDSGRSTMSSALYKHDFAAGSSVVAPLDPELLIGEMSFVPRPAVGSARLPEDDGILIGFGYHRGRAEGQLLLLDAQTCESVATVHLPQRVPMGFHGNWVPRD